MISMPPSRSPLALCRSLALAGVLLPALVVGCGEAPTAVQDVADVMAAKGGIPGPPSDGGGDGGDDTDGSSDPSVEDTDPGAAPQDTTLDVRVFGTGFDAGSNADFLLEGETTKTVMTNSTTFVNDTELIANITISADAVPELYDVRVTTSKGKKGVGIELFEVEGPTTDLAGADVESGAGLYSDGKGYYIGEFNTNTTRPNPDNASYNTRPQCDEGRRVDLRLPTDADGNPVWPLAGPISDCQGDGARSQLHMPTLLLADCPDGFSCPIGTAGHEGGTSFSPDLNYFFVVDAGNDGFTKKPSNEEPHNVVWTDGLFQVLRRGSDGTPCRWEIVASAAELWNGAVRYEPAGQAVSLYAIVHRVDGPCAFGTS